MGTRHGPTDPDAIVENLRAHFEAKPAHVHPEPDRYARFAAWAVAAGSSPESELAAVLRREIQTAARTNREAWHAELMIRIVTLAERPDDLGDLDDDVDGSARPSSLADMLAMPLKPPGKRGRKPKDPEFPQLVAEPVKYCDDNGYKPTASSSTTKHWGCLLVAEALVSAKTWANMDADQRNNAERKVREAWFEYKKPLTEVMNLQRRLLENAREFGTKGG